MTNNTGFKSSYEPDFMTNVSISDGWTREIITQAATETGALVRTGEPTRGQNPSESFSIWSLDNKDKNAFWDCARRLIDEVKQGD